MKFLFFFRAELKRKERNEIWSVLQHRVCWFIQRGLDIWKEVWKERQLPFSGDVVARIIEHVETTTFSGLRSLIATESISLMKRLREQRGLVDKQTSFPKSVATCFPRCLGNESGHAATREGSLNFCHTKCRPMEILLTTVPTRRIAAVRLKVSKNKKPIINFKHCRTLSNF